MRIRSTLIVLAIAGSLLSACHKQQPAPDNQQVEAPAPVEQTQAPAEEAPAPPPAPKPEAPKAKPTPKPTADQQMLDDADATGMTSHTSSDADGSGATGNSQP